MDFANRLYGSPEVTGSKRFSKPKLSQTGFAIEHYAGGVAYKTDNFLNKNKDFVVAEHQQLMQSSDQAFVRMLFPADPEPAADGTKASSGCAFTLSNLADAPCKFWQCLKQDCGHKFSSKTISDTACLTSAAPLLMSSIVATC